VDAIHRRHPDCRIDYAFNHKMGALLGADPKINRTFAVLRGGDESTAANIAMLNDLLTERSYDLVVSFSPFVTASRLDRARCPVITPLGFAIDLLRAIDSGGVASMPFRVGAWLEAVIEGIAESDREQPDAGGSAETRVYLPAASIERASRLIHRAGLPDEQEIVYLNPDTSNRSTFLGSDFHIRVLRGLLGSGPAPAVLLGRGFTYPGIEEEILGALGPENLRRVQTVPPDLSLEDFAALVDRCRFYIGGDTGPLHIAAARKIESTMRFRPRNELAVVGVFKATDPRIYGYDSFRQDMIGSSQDATAVTIESRPSCKNLTCSLQRISASCDTRKCHDALDPDRVVGRVLEISRELEQAREWLPATGTLGS